MIFRNPWPVSDGVSSGLWTSVVPPASTLRGRVGFSSRVESEGSIIARSDGGVSQDGIFLSVGKMFLDPRGGSVSQDVPRASKKSDLGQWMAAPGPLVLGAWPGRPSTKAGNG